MRELFSRPGVRSRAIDLLIVVVLGVGSVPSIVASGRSSGVALGITVALLAPIFARRRLPVQALLFALAVFAVHTLVPPSYAGWLLAADLALPVLMYSVMVYGDRRSWLWLLLASEAVFLAGLFLVLGSGSITAIVFLAQTAIMVAAVATGEVTRVRKRQLAIAQERAIEAEEHRDALARAAVVEERARIAREMHDVVAHAVSTMVMQSEGARLVGERNRAAVDAALRTIGVTGREAVAELRRILGLLRESESGTKPPPSVGELTELVAKVRSAGLETRLTVEGDPRGVPPGAALTTYRIVQEALTNVVKHAPSGARCTVEVDCGTLDDPHRTVVVAIANDGGDGPRPPATGRSGAGYGIRGMRERASMFDGEVTAEPQPDGGFKVTALLPLTTSPEEL
ncbi:sensor histidine kinase [Amycolatopsis panacis]|uniref:histidine kinase n=1 Tax=Amycolatopsis panacis TaxID=2340917 RepID=A0A419IAY6_9PSEU|nr:sensor histidine kinase [Amycolatopsis panacis]RJQ91262.1 sensor histidine kinase [Amycolatopsis panacis]